jgi:hypothetical protein
MAKDYHTNRHHALAALEIWGIFFGRGCKPGEMVMEEA